MPPLGSRYLGEAEGMTGKTLIWWQRRELEERRVFSPGTLRRAAPNLEGRAHAQGQSGHKLSKSSLSTSTSSSTPEIKYRIGLPQETLSKGQYLPKTVCNVMTFV
jgi:hypothetical protein